MPQRSIELTFEGGTVAIRCGREALPPALRAQPWVRWDPRSRSYRVLAFRYRQLLGFFQEEGVPVAVDDRVLRPLPFGLTAESLEIALRPYQQEALERWLRDGGGRGAVELPTGAGKTFIALGAIAHLRCSTFVVVPTLDLVDQWKRALAPFEERGIEIGELTGREKSVKPLTVATYDSAYIHADRVGNRFPLIVFDEVHHLPAPGYRHIAEFFASPYRLGLTATYEREDKLHEELAELLGGVVFEVSADELTGEYLAPYVLERIYVDLTPEERAAYDREYGIFRKYLKKHRIRIARPQDFERFVYRSGADPEAWRAVRARHRAVQIAFNARQKREELRRLLERHRDDRVIVFTRFNDLVYEISKTFFLPCITYKTGREERAEVLEGFRRGEYRAIASSQVLDEGVDVPEANVGILLSGTGSSREFVQRLGRLLRPREGKRAVLYEIIARGTGEERTASRRRKKLRTPKRKG